MAEYRLEALGAKANSSSAECNAEGTVSHSESLHILLHGALLFECKHTENG